MYLIDTETASLNGGVCEIAWLQLDSDLTVLSEFVTRVNPEREIEPGAFAVHGISNDDVADSPTLSQVLVDMPAGFTMLAYNVDFDYRMIRAHAHPARKFCILKLARAVVAGVTNHKLETLKVELGLSEQASHSALGDVYTSLEVLRHCLSLTDTPLETLIARQSTPVMVSVMPFGVHKGKPMLQVPKPYRLWLAGQPHLSADLAYTLKRLNAV